MKTKPYWDESYLEDTSADNLTKLRKVFYPHSQDCGRLCIWICKLINSISKEKGYKLVGEGYEAYYKEQEDVGHPMDITDSHLG